MAFVHGNMGDVESIRAGAHFGGGFSPPFRASPTLRIGFMFPISLLNSSPLSFSFASSLGESVPGTLQTPVGLKAERTPGWKPMLLSTEDVALRPRMCPWFLADVTLMSRALSCSSELLFFDIPTLLRNGEEDIARLPESETEGLLWPLLGEVEVLGISPDFGDLLKVSVPLACSLLTNPRPLLSAQWKWTWAFSVFGYLNILQQYQQI